MEPLHREVIAAPGAAPTAWLLMTHGILGAGGNWRAVARRLVGARPDVGVLLVDLRGHGRSPDGAPPHTVAACADDLVRLVAEEAGRGRPITALAGHSFGGKVVAVAAAALPAAPAQVWLLDSAPGPHPQGRPSVQRVLDVLAGLPEAFADRAAFEAAVLAAGQPPAIAQWLALSLRPATTPDEPRALRFDLPQIRALIADYLVVDAWAGLLASRHRARRRVCVGVFCAGIGG
jgi:esterase